MQASFLFDRLRRLGEQSELLHGAAIYSLIGPAKLNEVDPEAWLRHVPTHMADHPVNRIAEFLPWHATDPTGSPAFGYLRSNACGSMTPGLRRSP
jgi:hypothetical protein